MTGFTARAQSVVGFVWGTMFVAAVLADQPPALHRQIDQLIQQSQLGPVAAGSSDAEFLRRVTLDLAGRIPTLAEAREFLKDSSPDKRVNTIDRLLQSEEFARHMAIVFDVLLMERRGGKHVKTEDLREYLSRSFAAGKPYNVLVREILAADGTDAKIRPAAAFYLEREAEPNLISREIGRVFFGRDLQCAQCHDHPLIEDYAQADFYGLHAFVVRMSLFQPDPKQPALVAESGEGDSNFKSVFTDREGFSGPRLPEGKELAEPMLTPDLRYEVAPAKNVRPIPRQSRLAELAQAATDGSNRAFNRNIANRLWAHMFGRGIVHPVDLHHSHNPPSHPELLDLLADAMPGLNYDVKAFLRELALTEAYQRSYRLPALTVEAAADAEQQIAKLNVERQSRLEAAGSAEATLEGIIQQLDQAVAAARPLREAVTKANDAIAAAVKTRVAAVEKVTASEQVLSGKQSQLALVGDALAATRKAAESLKDDKELAAALATLQQKSTSLEGEIAKLNEALAAQKQAVAAADAAIKELHPPADEAIARLTPADEQIRQLRAELAAHRKTAADARQSGMVIQRRIELLQLIVDHHRQEQRLAELQGAIPQAEQQVAAAEGGRAAAGKNVSAADQAQTEVAQRHLAAKDAMAKADAALQEVLQTRSLVADSLVKLEQVAARIDGKEHVNTAIVQVQSTAQKVQSQVAQAEKQLAARRKEVETIAQELAAAQAQVTTAKGALADAEGKLAQARSRLQSAQRELAQLAGARVQTSSALIEASTRRTRRSFSPMEEICAAGWLPEEATSPSA